MVVEVVGGPLDNRPIHSWGSTRVVAQSAVCDSRSIISLTSYRKESKLSW